MATIKSYTDINQSKKLAEILPLESADMYYNEELVGKLVCSPGHSCEDIPYCLNGGEGYKHYKYNENEL